MLKKELRVNENRPQDMGELLTLSDTSWATERALMITNSNHAYFTKVLSCSLGVICPYAGNMRAEGILYGLPTTIFN
jgi:hypothetical protein